MDCSLAARCMFGHYLLSYSGRCLTFHGRRIYGRTAQPERSYSKGKRAYFGATI
jgi:hypothetical protein